MVNTWKVPYQFRYLHKESIQHKNSAFKSQQNQGRKALQSSNKKGKFPYSFLYGNAVWGFKNLQQINVSELPTNKKCRTAESIIKINEKTVHQLRHTAKSTAFLAITSLKRHAWLLYYQDNRPKKCHQKMKCHPRNANTITKS